MIMHASITLGGWRKWVVLFLPRAITLGCWIAPLQGWVSGDDNDAPQLAIGYPPSKSNWRIPNHEISRDNSDLPLRLLAVSC
jgi:hypothetical protein